MAFALRLPYYDIPLDYPITTFPYLSGLDIGESYYMRKAPAKPMPINAPLSSSYPKPPLK